MDWDAIGAVGEIVGAFAVVVSVIYLAVQVKKQTEESRLAASRELAGQWGSAISGITTDLDQTALWLNACREYLSLSGTERVWAAFIFHKFMRIMEQQRLHLENRNVDHEYFKSLENSWRAWVRYPGVQQWWAVAHVSFGSEFQSYVEKLISEAREKGFEDSFKDDTDHPPNKSVEPDA